MPIIRHKGVNYTASSDNVSDSNITYESGDELNPTAPSEVAQLTNTETTKSFAQKVSTVVKNVRYLLKMLGSTDISAIGDGTTTAAIKSLWDAMPAKLFNNATSVSVLMASYLSNYPNGCAFNIVGNSATCPEFSGSGLTNLGGWEQFVGYLQADGNYAGTIYARYRNAAFSITGNKNNTDAFISVAKLNNTVTGIKGDKEDAYREGDVNLTPENIGAVGAAAGIDFKLGVENGLLYYEEV